MVAPGTASIQLDPQDALDEMATMGRGYCSLEIDLESGQRTQRHLSVQKLLIELTGAESALVVNKLLKRQQLKKCLLKLSSSVPGHRS